MPPPSLADKAAFFPTVLNDKTFQRSGVLFGKDPNLANDCQWVVVDPNRHKLAIWKKTSVTANFVECGKALNASVFTNGPMIHSRYEKQFDTPVIGGLLTKAYSGFGYGAAEIQKAMGDVAIAGEKQALRFFVWAGSEATAEERTKGLNRWEKRETEKAHDEADMSWFVAGPYGDIVAKDSGIPNLARAGGTIDVNVGQTGMHLGYFGRKADTSFESYEIGKDNPDGLTEASGGLYDPELLNGKSNPSSLGSNMWFYWGLAPLKPQTPDTVGLKSALAAYAAAPGNKPVSGLIVGLYFQDHTRNVQLLANIGVTDAVRLDGGDSTLFGYGSTALVGMGMSHHKRIWMQYGFAFFPIK